MEFVAGIFVAFACLFASNYFINHYINHKSIRFRVNDSQSRKFQIIAPIMQYTVTNIKKELKTQATDFFDNTSMRIVLFDDQAYWIQANTLYTAPFENGKVEESVKQVVDTMALNDVELKKVIGIVERLTERINNEDYNSGK
jgi:hypothetical protein